MRLFATLQQSATWTQKQLVGLVVVGGILLVLAVKAYKKHNMLFMLAVVAVLVWLGRGIGTGGP